MVASKNKQQVYLTGHPEYDATTLDEEFHRDLKVDQQAAKPENYYINDDATNVPHSSWRSHGSLLFTNWLNYYVYQITPYKLDASNIQAIHPDTQI